MKKTKIQPISYVLKVDTIVHDDPIATVIEPNLTTIHYPGKEMGEIAMQSIINHLNGSLNINPANTIILHSKLIIRDSSLRKRILN